MEKLEKTKKLNKIINSICSNEGIKKGKDIDMSKDSERICFTFVNGVSPYLDTNKAGMGEVFKIAEKYELRRDNCSRVPVHGEDKFYIRFKLKADIN